jgi:predicted dehydrogenase
MGRFELNNSILDAIVHEGMLGRIVSIKAEQGTIFEWPMATDSYFNRASTTGGILFDTGIHLIDRILQLFGPLSGLELEDDSYGGPESNAILRATLNVAGNVVPCRMAFSWTHHLKNRLRVEGTMGAAEIRLGEPDAVYVQRLISARPMELVVRTREAPPYGNSFRRQWEDFATAIHNNRTPLVPARSAVECLRVIERAYAVRRRMAQPWVEANRVK